MKIPSNGLKPTIALIATGLLVSIFWLAVALPAYALSL
jgi:hypothetical protein